MSLPRIFPFGKRRVNMFIHILPPKVITYVRYLLNFSDFETYTADLDPQYISQMIKN